MKRDELMVPAEKLRRTFGSKDFSFKDTSKISPVKEFIGQERALAALKVGLKINQPAYNVFAVGQLGTGRRGVLQGFLEKFAEEHAAKKGVVLTDFCYVYNFDKPEQPRILRLPKGEGKRLEEFIRSLLMFLQVGVAVVYSSDEFTKIKDDIAREIDIKKNQLDETARQAGFVLMPTQIGLGVALASSADPSRPMMQAEHDKLSVEKQAELEKRGEAFSKKLSGKIKEFEELQKKSFQRIKDLENGMINAVVETAFRPLSREYENNLNVLGFLNGLKGYTFKIIDAFNPSEKQQTPFGFQMREEDRFSPFKVNVLVDNSQKSLPPIVFESQPTFTNLFGRIDRTFVQGAYLSDHTHLKPGSLCLADGGYLVLNIKDIGSTEVWVKLKKTLRSGLLKMEEPFSYLGFNSSNLEPEPIPINVKVIVLGESEAYHFLTENDPDFLAIFKIKAEFDSEMNATPANLEGYAGFVAACCGRDGLLPFDRTGIAKVAEYGVRLADDQQKLSTRFDKIKDLVTESSYWAEESASKIVGAEHVVNALAAQRSRLNLVEGKVQEAVRRDIILIETVGTKVGQINGLSVYGVGDYAFGAPAKITAQTSLGRKGLVSIQRETKMSGPIHDSGLLILNGYFSAKYGQKKLISFSASLCFEQSYGGVEGDSASVAELSCLISSLSELPINQALAVTGSVNQKGEIQPIGGVNQKIEGFFDICRERGLTGAEGVVIPQQNIQHLMLREDVVEAVKTGKFKVYAIKDVDEGLEILMDTSVADIHRKVELRLSEMSKKMKEKQAEEN